MLFIAGASQLAFSSMAQTLVQLEAPPELRGREVGLFSMANNGLRLGSGITVGVLGAVVGIHWSLGLSAIAVIPLAAVLLVFAAVRSSVRPAINV